MHLTCKNFHYFRWAIVIDSIWWKYFVKVIQNFAFKRGLMVIDGKRVYLM